MSDEKLLPCPRCGGGVKVGPMPYSHKCQNNLCGVWWQDARRYEAECVARDLAGTRATQVDADWLPAPERESGLDKELQSLVYLVRLETLRAVENQLTMAIDGRDNPDYKAQGELKANIEREVLMKMRSWIKKMQSIAEENQQ